MDPSSRSSPPVALRIVRPYRTEDELLSAEANAFTRTGVVLIGAPSRPSGVVLRFEIVLADGTPAMRGEGRVVGYRPPTSAEEGALMLRFTRLDVKSKGLLDRAVALREERRSIAPPASAPQRSAPEPEKIEPKAPQPARSVAPPASNAPRAAAATYSVASVARASSQPPRTERTEEPAGGPIEDEGPATDRPLAPEGEARDREALVPPLAEVALGAHAGDVEASDVEADAVEDALEVDEVDLASADESDLTVQAPPVALSEPHDHAEASGAGPKHPEKAPVPQPSPGRVPAPHPEPPAQPTPPRQAPEHAPVPRLPPEHMPSPSPSPTKPRRPGAREAFRPTLEPAQRSSALDRLRARQRAKQV